MKYHLLNLAFFLCAGYSNAAVVVLNFNGVYDTAGNTLFGLSGAAVPFNYQITYDTSLDTDNDFIASGSTVGGNLTTHDWYAYSKSGITATSLTFGSQTWTTTDDFLPRVPSGSAFSADLWFDTDISLAAPTKAVMDLDNGNGNYLGFGEMTINGGELYITPYSFVGNPIFEAQSTSFAIQSSVPEPSRSVLLLLGLLMVQSRRKRTTA